MEGTSADAGSHYQKLYGRVTDVCGNRRGQPRRSAMQEPHPGRSPFVIRFTSPSGKYAFPSLPTTPHRARYSTCGFKQAVDSFDLRCW